MRRASGWNSTSGALGAINGNNAHAWPEIRINGEWRIFEPPPPYATDDLFAYVCEEDRPARRQLEALFGASAGGKGAGKPAAGTAEMIERTYGAVE